MVNYVMVFIPHQDDEICLMGEYLDRRLYKDNVVLKLVYLTNGDYMTAAATRQTEALRAVHLFGVEEKDVIFLGYPDTPFESDTPYTDKRLNEITLSIEQLLQSFTPNIIFCTDLDPHPDHRALSLCFNRAMASVLKNTEGYRPIVFKGLAYSTAFYGKQDYSRINNPPTVIPDPTRPDNPSFNWNTRIRLKNPGTVNQTPLWNNRIYKALLKHKSQCGLRYYQSIINSDQVFFKMRTDNLLFSNSLSEVKVSSGTKEYLNDLLTGCLSDIMDCSNKSELQDCIWKPDKQDLSPAITIRFKQPQPIEYISINGNPNLQQQAPVEIVINGKLIIPIPKLEEYGKETIIYIRNQEVRSIYLAFPQPCLGISELGAFKKEYNLDLFRPVIPRIFKSNKLYNMLINYLEWIYIRISWISFRFNRKINYLVKRIKKI